MIRSGSLRIRLLAVGAVSTCLALALAGFGLTQLFSRHVEQRVEAELTGILDQLAAGLEKDPTTGQLVVQSPPASSRFNQPLSGLYWQITSQEGNLRSRSLWDGWLDLPGDGVADGHLHKHETGGPDGAPLLVLDRQVVLPERLGSELVRISVAVVSSEISDAAYSFALGMLPYMLLLAAVLTAASALQVTVGLSPLKGIRSRLSQIRANPQARIGSAFPDELKPVAAAIDDLLSAREDQIVRARSRAADLAHGLKTPLQVLMGDVERLRAAGEREIADEIEQVAAAMRRHVERELAHARLNLTGHALTPDVARIISQITRVMERTPAGTSLGWRVEAPPSLAAAIDPDDLGEALGNLVENAVRHASSCIRITARAEEERVRISVEDDGPGMTQEQISHCLVRGNRLDEEDTSPLANLGLGLSIVQEIAVSSGGMLELAARPSGGLCASLLLRPATVPSS